MAIPQIVLKKTEPEMTVDEIHSTLPAILSGLVELLVEKKILTPEELKEKIAQGIESKRG